MQQKAQIIATILHRPELLIIDEPFSGLDPVNTELVKDLLVELNQSGVTVIMSTHQMHQVEELCDRILLVNQGRQVLLWQPGRGAPPLLRSRGVGADQRPWPRNPGRSTGGGRGFAPPQRVDRAAAGRRHLPPTKCWGPGPRIRMSTFGIATPSLSGARPRGRGGESRDNVTTRARGGAIKMFPKIALEFGQNGPCDQPLNMPSWSSPAAFCSAC